MLISSTHPTLVDDGRAGTGFAPDDPSAMAGAIIDMVNTTDAERRTMGERRRKMVERNYSIEAIAGRYEALLKDVIARHRHTRDGV